MHNQGLFTILYDFPPPDLEISWRDCLVRADFPSHYSSPDFFREPFFVDKRPFAILALQDSRVVGVLTGLHEGDHVISGLVPRPQICFANTVDQTAAGALAQGLLTEAGPAKLISFHTWTPVQRFLSYKFRCRQEEGVVMLDLREGPEALFKQFSSMRRNNIRKAMRKGVEVFQASTEDDFTAYHEIYCSWCQRKGISPLPFSVIAQALRLRDNRRLFLARFSGKIVAGIILRFYPGGLIEYAANSSLKEFLFLKPNDILHWGAVEWASGAGFTRYSLGGAHLFLRHFGGTIVPTFRYRLDRTWLRRHDLREAVLDTGRRMLRHLPIPVKTTVRRVLDKA
jgi:hypothetical protein